MFSNDCDFDIDEDFLKDVFQSAEEHAVPKRSSPPPQETVVKKLRVGSSEPPPTPAVVQHGEAAPLLFPVETPSSSVKKRRPEECTSRQRKFPGPAGLLPDRVGSLNRTLEMQSDSEDDSEMPSKSLCSQPSGSVFQSEAWLQAERDLVASSPARETLSTCTVRWVRGKALAGQLPNLRVPFLLVALHTIDCTLQDPFVRFHDPTGQMPGTLHREVREEHEARLRPGTVLALRQVGVLSTRRTLRNHYLNVTANNLVSIYHSPDQLRPDHVEVVRVRDVSLLEAAQSIRDIQERRLVVDLPAAHLLDEQLFSCVGGSGVQPRNVSPVIPRLPCPGVQLRNMSPVIQRSPCPGVQPRNASSAMPRSPCPGVQSRNASPVIQRSLCLDVQPRNVSSHVSSRFSGNQQAGPHRGLTDVRGRTFNESPSPVSSFHASYSPSICPQTVPAREVSGRFSGSGSKPAVVPSKYIMSSGTSNGQIRSLGHMQSNLISQNESGPNKVLRAQGFAFKPKTSQLGNLGTPHLSNGWNSGVPLENSASSSNVQGHLEDTLCSLKAVDTDDERRIVENVLESFDPSQLFDEDF